MNKETVIAVLRNEAEALHSNYLFCSAEIPAYPSIFWEIHLSLLRIIGALEDAE